MTAGNLRDQALARCDEDPAAAVRYTAAQGLAAINEAYRLFAFFTFALEKTANLTLTGGIQWYTLLTQLTDFIAVLRIKNGPLKLLPGNLAVFAGRDSAWQTATGTADRYAVLGFDLLALNKAPASGGTLAVTYAYSPATLAAGDTPAIPAEWQPALINYAVPRLRVRDGGIEFRGAMEYHWPKWMETVQRAAQHVRAKNLVQRYDRMPMEWAFYDQSRAMKAMLGSKKAPALVELEVAGGRG